MVPMPCQRWRRGGGSGSGGGGDSNSSMNAYGTALSVVVVYGAVGVYLVLVVSRMVTFDNKILFVGFG